VSTIIDLVQWIVNLEEKVKQLELELEKEKAKNG